ncbi:MAG: MraY family glycosyltransferase [Anaerolineales bacterium]
MTLSQTFQFFLVGLALTFVSALVAVALARRVALMDFPGSAPHKQHSRPTPLAGGIALMLTLAAAGAFLGLFANLQVRAIFLASLPVFGFALWDDKAHLLPRQKLVGQTLGAIALIALGVHVRIFDSPEFFVQLSPLLSRWLNWGFTLFWMVGLTNAFNFVDSMDGLAVGLAMNTALFFALFTFDAAQLDFARLSLILLGACAALYALNSAPAVFFLGDSGAQTLGFWLAALAIVYSPQGANQSSSWFVPLLLLGVPLFDTTLVVVSRWRRGLPVYRASRDHTYHRLIARRVAPTRAVLTMHGAAVLLGALAAICLGLPPFAANLILLGVVLLGALTLLWLEIGYRGENQEIRK